MQILRIEPDPEKLKQVQNLLEALPEKAGQVVRSALNKGMMKGAQVAIGDLAATMTAQQSSVRKRVRLFKATLGKPAAALYIKGGRGVNMYAFGAKQIPEGVIATVMGQSKFFPEEFIVTGLEGNKIVAFRMGGKVVPKKGRYVGRTIKRGPRAGQPILRQKLDSRYGPPVAEIWAKTPGIADKTTTAINQTTNAELQSKLDKIMAGDNP